MNRKLNIFLISLIVLLIATLIIVRFQFSKKVEDFTKSINSYELSIHENFNKLKLQKIDSVSRIDKQIVELFKKQFDENKAIIEKDTSLAYLYLTKKISYKDLSPKYLDCLFDKCNIDKKNEKILKEIESNDWSLTPGRYVGVAPEEVDENFDFEETMREIHVELEDLNMEAVGLAATIKENFEELGI